MKPPKSLYPLASWLMRISLLLLAYELFWEELRLMDYRQVSFWLAAGFSFFSLLLFVGGFMARSDMTIVSSFILMGIALYKLYDVFSWPPHLNMVIYLLIASSSMVLFTQGNK